MSRNGSGIYNLPAGNPVVTGTTITSSWANTTMQNIADGLTQSVASDGQTPMTGALNMANNKITAVTDPTSAQDAATKAYVDAATADIGADYLAKASNLSDVANATTSRGNLSAAKSGANSDITSLTGLTTPLSVAQGGTSASTLTANNVILGNGTSAVQFVAPGTTGNILKSNGTTWTSAAPSATGVTSVATGNGLSGGTITSTGTLTIAAPTYNSVGSYAFAASLNDSAGSTVSAGSDYAAGTGTQQIKAATLRNSVVVSSSGLSGTWRWMNLTDTGPDNTVAGIACRVS